MTTPNIPGAPDDAFVVGSDYGSNLTESSIMAIATGGAKSSFTGVQGAIGSQVRDPIDNTYTIAVAAGGRADEAADSAEVAANAAVAAEEAADVAREVASYWEAECVVASAAILLGVNELLIGLCQNVPTGRVREITDLHFALLSQPAGIVIETKKWNAAGTSSSVIHTATLGANVTRINYNNLFLDMQDKERIYWNVTSVTGTEAPVALQVLAFGSII